MSYIKDFNFEVMHSLNRYKDKEQSKIALSYFRVREYNRSIDNPNDKMDKMAFVKETISVDQFVEMATSGYTFCNLFTYDPNRKYRSDNKWKNLFWPEYMRGKNKGAMKMQMKSDSYFLGTQCVFVDIDYTDYKEMEGFIAALLLKPTVAYYSYSDNVFKKDKKQKGNPKYDFSNGIKSRRFRLCFIFDKIIYGEEDFIKISTAIKKMVEASTHEPVQDNCGTLMSQYFNGSMNKDVYVSYRIYNMNDFREYITPHPCTIYNESPQKGQSLTGAPEKSSQQISRWLVYDMERLDYDEFMHYNRPQYKYWYRMDIGIWTNGYQIIGDGYFSLYYNVKKLKDGQKRRKTLFERMCLRRVMFPGITPDEVLFCAYEDLHRFIDNSKDPVEVECLVKNVRSAFKYTINEIEQKYSHHIAYLRSKAPKHGLIYDLRGAKTQAERNTRMAEIRYTRYDTLYNSDLSVKENAETIGVCEKTIRRYCKQRGIATSNRVTDEELRQLIDRKKSVRANVTFLKDAYDIKVSKDRTSKILNELKSLNKLFHDKTGWYIVILNKDWTLSMEYYPTQQRNNVIDTKQIPFLYCLLESVA